MIVEVVKVLVEVGGVVVIEVFIGIGKLMVYLIVGYVVVWV